MRLDAHLSIQGFEPNSDAAADATPRGAAPRPLLRRGLLVRPALLQVPPVEASEGLVRPVGGCVAGGGGGVERVPEARRREGPPGARAGPCGRGRCGP